MKSCFFRRKVLSSPAVRRALDADVPSGSEDERFGPSDDSDADPDYKETGQSDQEESSDDDDPEELPEPNEPSSTPSAPSQDPGPSVQRENGASKPSGGPAKKIRAEWNWVPDDIPYEPLPDNNFTVKGNIYT
jgi:hypothetical protein